GAMGRSALECLITMYNFKEIRCTSRRAETREDFAREWSDKLGIPVTPDNSPETAVRGADIVVGGTTSTEVVSRADWLKAGSTFLSLARKELAPSDFRAMDKVVLDDFDLNMLEPEFAEMVASNEFTRDE